MCCWKAGPCPSCGRMRRGGGLFDELHYRAPHPANRTEVDFLLRRGGELAAIEVKSQSH